MPIDTGVVIQYLALGLGVTGVVLSLSYSQTLVNRLRLTISSNEKKTEGLAQQVDDVTAKTDNAIITLRAANAHTVESVSKNIQQVMKNMDDLNVSINQTNKRIDRLSKEMISANYNIRKGDKELTNLYSKIQKLADNMKSLNKSGNELESEISKLGRVTLWAERNVKELKSEVKHVKSIRRNGKHRKVNGNGNGNGKSHKGNGRHVNGNVNDNIKHIENVLVEENTP